MWTVWLVPGPEVSLFAYLSIILTDVCALYNYIYFSGRPGCQDSTLVITIDLETVSRSTLLQCLTCSEDGERL